MADSISNQARSFPFTRLDPTLRRRYPFTYWWRVSPVRGDDRFPKIRYVPIQPHFALEFNFFEYGIKMRRQQPLVRVARQDFATQGIAQRLEMFFVIPPVLERAAVNGLLHLL